MKRAKKIQFGDFSSLSPNRNCPSLILVPHATAGTFISVCGIDGSEKSRMIEAIADYIERLGLTVTVNYTPKDRARKDRLFHLLMDPKKEVHWHGVDILGMCQIILGELYDHIQDKIVPQLTQGNVVICDRYIFTSQVEVVARAVDYRPMYAFAHFSKSILRPDLAICMQADAALARQRVLDREDESEQPPTLQFMEKQAKAYRVVSEANQLLNVDSSAEFESNFIQLIPRLNRCISERAQVF